MLRVIDHDPNNYYETEELVQEFQFQQASLTVENEKVIAMRSESATRRRLIDDALSRLKNRLAEHDEELVSIPFRRKSR